MALQWNRHFIFFTKRTLLIIFTTTSLLTVWNLPKDKSTSDSQNPSYCQCNHQLQHMHIHHPSEQVAACRSDGNNRLYIYHLGSSYTVSIGKTRICRNSNCFFLINGNCITLQIVPRQIDFYFSCRAWGGDEASSVVSIACPNESGEISAAFR